MSTIYLRNYNQRPPTYVQAKTDVSTAGTYAFHGLRYPPGENGCFPGNYPEVWDKQLQVSMLPDTTNKTSALSQSQAETVLQSAKEDVNPKLSAAGQQQLSQIDIKVVDLSGETLGRVDTDTIYLDVYAAGFGWFVDETPLDHSEFQYESQLSLIALPGSEAEGLIDLWTVIRHELGHLLGYEPADEGVMEAALDPGERKLAEWD